MCAQQCGWNENCRYILNAPVMPFSKSNFNWPVLIKILQFWWQQSPQWSQPWDSCVIHTQHTRTSFWNIFFNNNHNNEATDGIVLFIITTLILYFNIRILQLWRQRSQWYSCGIYILWNCLIGPSGKLSEFVFSLAITLIFKFPAFGIKILQLWR